MSSGKSETDFGKQAEARKLSYLKTVFHRYGILRNQVTDIKEKRTYKDFVEVTITYEMNGEELTVTFKAIHKPEEKIA